MRKTLRILAGIAVSPLLLVFVGVPLLFFVLLEGAVEIVFGVVGFALTGEWQSF